jgi:hypothetical protein
VTDTPEAKPSGGEDFAAGGERKPTQPEKPPRRDYAFATERELADLRQQRDRAEARRAEQEQFCRALQERLSALQDRMRQFEAENARLETSHRAVSDTLESERMDRGVVGLIGTVLAAIGGGLVSVWEGLPRAVFLALLLSGCLFMGYSSLRNLSADIRTLGIRGWLKRLWSGRHPS